MFAVKLLVVTLKLMAPLESPFDLSFLRRPCPQPLIFTASFLLFHRFAHSSIDTVKRLGKKHSVM